MGLFSDIWDGVSAIGDSVGSLFGGGSDAPTDFVDPAPGDSLPSGGGMNFNDISSSSSDTGGFAGAAKAAGGALTSLAGGGGVGTAGTNPVPSVRAQGTYNRVPIDNNGSPGKAQRAPTADPNQIYNQWEARLSSFMGPRK